MPGCSWRGAPSRLLLYQSSWPSPRSRLKPEKALMSMPDENSAADALHRRKSRVRCPRDWAPAGFPGSRTLVTAAKRPADATPSQVPPASRSRPATSGGASGQSAAAAVGRAKNSSRFAATTSGNSGKTCQATRIRHMAGFLPEIQEVATGTERTAAPSRERRVTPASAALSMSTASAS
jgi:hypothetical protein